MQRYWWIWVLGLVGISVAAGFGISAWTNRVDDSEFEDQIRFARAEGIPTNPAEFALAVPHAKPDENAAPFYERLTKPIRFDERALRAHVIFRHNPDDLKKAEQLLSQYNYVLDAVDHGTKLPRCWFNRDWSKGLGVLYPEYAGMKQAAKLLTVRGSITAARGHVDEALDNYKECLVLAKHVSEEPLIIPELVAEAIYAIATLHLAEWSYANPSEARYFAEFKAAVANLPKPNLQHEHVGDLFMALWVLDTLVSEEKRRAGEDAHMSTTTHLVPLSSAQRHARAEIVRAERAYYQELRDKGSMREAFIRGAVWELYQALHNFPTTGDLAKAMMDEDPGEDPAIKIPKVLRRHQQMLIALQRALESHPTPHNIKTADLLSPFDKKPVTYSFDGRQIVISSPATKTFNPVPIKIPPDIYWSQ